MKTFLLLWTILFLFLEIKSLIEIFSRTEREISALEMNKDMKNYNAKYEKDIVKAVVVLFITYSLLIISYLHSLLIVVLALVYMGLTVYVAIYNYIEDLKNINEDDYDEDDMKISISGAIIDIYCIGFLVYVVYNLMAKQ